MLASTGVTWVPIQVEYDFTKPSHVQNHKPDFVLIDINNMYLTIAFQVLYSM